MHVHQGKVYWQHKLFAVGLRIDANRTKMMTCDDITRMQLSKTATVATAMHYAVCRKAYIMLQIVISLFTLLFTLLLVLHLSLLLGPFGVLNPGSMNHM